MRKLEKGSYKMYNNRLLELREYNNLRQSDLGKIISVKENAYGQYEREYVIIPLKHLNAICSFYNISIDYIFSFTNIKQYKNINKEIDIKLASKRLKEFRKENKITQDKLATILNTNQSVIANYERGRTIISTPILINQ